MGGVPRRVAATGSAPAWSRSPTSWPAANPAATIPAGPWDGDFITDDKGRNPRTPQKLGQLLAGQADRCHGEPPLTLRAVTEIPQQHPPLPGRAVAAMTPRQPPEPEPCPQTPQTPQQPA